MVLLCLLRILQLTTRTKRPAQAQTSNMHPKCLIRSHLSREAQAFSMEDHHLQHTQPCIFNLTRTMLWLYSYKRKKKIRLPHCPNDQQDRLFLTRTEAKDCPHTPSRRKNQTMLLQCGSNRRKTPTHLLCPLDPRIRVRRAQR